MTLSLLLLSRWSFGILLYEIATIGMYEVSLFRATRYNNNSGVVFAALVLVYINTKSEPTSLSPNKHVRLNLKKTV